MHLPHRQVHQTGCIGKGVGVGWAVPSTRMMNDELIQFMDGIKVLAHSVSSAGALTASWQKQISSSQSRRRKSKTVHTPKRAKQSFVRHEASKADVSVVARHNARL